MTGEPDGIDAHVKDRAMDEAPVGIVISDPALSDNPLVYANETFQELTGYPSSDIVGRNCRFLQGDGTDPEDIEAMRSAIDAREPVTVEVLNYRRDGKAFWNEVTIAPLYSPDGDLEHFVGFQSDITQRKEAELALRERTDELEHLIGRLHGLVYDITEALMHAESREETEQTICERLVAVDRYAFAWVGEVAPVDGTVTPTAWAGAIDGLDDTPITGEGAHVLEDAIQHRTVVTVDQPSLLGGGPDVEAAVACPLWYRRQCYGVLVVGGPQQIDIDGPEAPVIEAIGRTIATAIHAAQTRQRLASSGGVHASVTIGDSAFPPVALAAGAEASLAFEGSLQRRDGSASLFFTTAAAVADLRSAAEAIATIESIDVVNTFDGQRLIEVTERSPSTIGWLATLGARITALTADTAGAEVDLTIGPDIDGREVVAAIRDRFDHTDLLAYRSIERPPPTTDEYLASIEEQLTERQHLVLKRAYLSGFYDRNRSVTGGELAESMGISRSTFHQHRRAAERKLIDAFLGPSSVIDD